MIILFSGIFSLLSEYHFEATMTFANESSEAITQKLHSNDWRERQRKRARKSNHCENSSMIKIIIQYEYNIIYVDNSLFVIASINNNNNHNICSSRDAIFIPTTSTMIMHDNYHYLVEMPKNGTQKVKICEKKMHQKEDKWRYENSELQYTHVFNVVAVLILLASSFRTDFLFYRLVTFGIITLTMVEWSCWSCLRHACSFLCRLFFLYHVHLYTCRCRARL